jgi:phosphohistidine phosphatase
MTDAPRRLLVLVRHAKAESGEEAADHDRRLTGKGRAAAAEAGRWLAENVPAPDLVLCSSATRARQTGEAFATSVPCDDVRVDRALYLAGAAEVLNEVGAAAAATTVVVGHNPTMEHVLVHSVGRLHGLRPGAVAVVDLEAGRLVATWEPAR